MIAKFSTTRTNKNYQPAARCWFANRIQSFT